MRFRDLFQPELQSLEATERERDTLLRLLAHSPDDARLVERWQRMLAAEERLTTPVDTPAKFCLRCYGELPCTCPADLVNTLGTPSGDPRTCAPEPKYKRKGKMQ
jgi:hypothetical protein